MKKLRFQEGCTVAIEFTDTDVLRDAILRHIPTGEGDFWHFEVDGKLLAINPSSIVCITLVQEARHEVSDAAIGKAQRQAEYWARAHTVVVRAYNGACNEVEKLAWRLHVARAARRARKGK